MEHHSTSIGPAQSRPCSFSNDYAMADTIATNLQAQVATLESELNRKTVEMATAGHDLRQPLQILLGALERLNRECPDDQRLFWLSAARDAGLRLTQGLTDLALAANESTSKVDVQELSLAALFDHLEADWAPLALEKRLSLSFVRPCYLIRSNSAILLTILSNLIGNAVKHTVAGGVVVGCRKIGCSFAIDVIDTGPGIDRATQLRMFNAFQQGDASREGLGLGLWIVAQSCQMLGYHMEVRTHPGRGSRFRLVIPQPIPNLMVRAI